MKSRNINLIIDDELLEQFDYEGMLVHPLEPQQAMLVMSSKDDTFTLRIYKLQLQDGLGYHIVKKLTTKTFSTLVGMKYFLNTFSHFKANDFINFTRKYDDKI
ncbi:hypothetical protein [Metabacillus rhizolycopersici]|uniref:Uncharacterized protein n=1 Tax=Metabacillus rhizolycopersici TaxID=2875709 RepID=A0ABS7UT73_9BACI|nr:hypothetical protein [Metabacillus rhizolycopersici]MBZ5751346.1 hypothetical protein [Metabacillus rhizolycopersici]